MFLNTIFDWFCESNIKYLAPFILPLNPLNLIQWMFFLVIFFVLLAMPANFTNSSDGVNRSGWRTSATTFLIYFFCSCIIYFILLFIFCGIVSVPKQIRNNLMGQFIPQQ